MVVFILAVLLAAGWYQTLFGSGVRKKAEYKESVSVAEEYNSRGLYQKAVQEYKKAIGIQNDKATWEDMLASYESRYQESSRIYGEYLDAAKQAASEYGDNPKFVLTLAKLYVDNGNYVEAHRCLKKAVDNGMEDESVLAMLREVGYGYELAWHTYDAFRSCTNGYFAVSEEGNWKYLKADGTEDDSMGESYEFASMAGEDGVRVMCKGGKGELVDSSGIVQGKIDFVPTEAMAYAEGLVPLEKGMVFSYYNALGDEVFGGYDFASSFTEGKAAVYDDKWKIIDTEGNVVSEEAYADIIFNIEGSYILNNVIVAQMGDAYALYNGKGEKIGDFTCEEMDKYSGDGMIAFCKNGKWGYVDIKGKIVIEPQFEKAKSFANGLAGVCVNDKWGFIDETGAIVVEPIFLDVDYFNEKGKCMVETGTGNWQMLSMNVWE